MEVLFNFQNTALEWDHHTYPGILRGQKYTLLWDIWEESGTELYKLQIKKKNKTNPNQQAHLQIFKSHITPEEL